MRNILANVIFLIIKSSFLYTNYRNFLKKKKTAHDLTNLFIIFLIYYILFLYIIFFKFKNKYLVIFEYLVSYMCFWIVF